MEQNTTNILACDGSHIQTEKYVTYSFALSTPTKVDIRTGKHDGDLNSQIAEYCGLCYGLMYAKEMKVKNLVVVTDNTEIEQNLKWWLKKANHKFPDWVTEIMEDCGDVVEKVLRVKGHQNPSHNSYHEILFKMVDISSRSFNKHTRKCSAVSKPALIQALTLS